MSRSVRGKQPGRTGTKLITIMGERILVDEYAGLCKTRGFRVEVRYNSGGDETSVTKRNTSARPGRSTMLALELTNGSMIRKRQNLAALDASLPASVPILSSSTTMTVAEQASRVAHPGRIVGLGAFPTLLGGSVMEFADSPPTTAPSRQAAVEFAASLGKEAVFVNDSVGLVMPRILCMLINEACFAMMEGVARGSDIDTAMKLGTNYPDGPVAWATRIGLRQVVAVMSALHTHFGEDRYRVAPLLHNAASLGGFRE